MWNRLHDPFDFRRVDDAGFHAARLVDEHDNPLLRQAAHERLGIGVVGRRRDTQVDEDCPVRPLAVRQVEIANNAGSTPLYVVRSWRMGLPRMQAA